MLSIECLSKASLASSQFRAIRLQEARVCAESSGCNSGESGRGESACIKLTFILS
jgi:hypothetical protein